MSGFASNTFIDTKKRSVYGEIFIHSFIHSFIICVFIAKAVVPQTLYRVDMAIQVGGSGAGQLFGMKI